VVQSQDTWPWEPQAKGVATQTRSAHCGGDIEDLVRRDVQRRLALELESRLFQRTIRALALAEVGQSLGHDVG